MWLNLQNYTFEKPWKMHVETYMCHTHTLIFVLKIFFIFLTLFSQTINVNGQIFFLWAGLEKLGNEHAFQPYTFSLSHILGGGAQNALPRLYIDSDHPAFIWLNVNL